MESKEKGEKMWKRDLTLDVHWNILAGDTLPSGLISDSLFLSPSPLLAWDWWEGMGVEVLDSTALDFFSPNWYIDPV